MFSSWFFLFLLTLFNFFFCQIFPNYRFFFIIENKEYDLSMENNTWAIQFSLLLINKTEITLEFNNYYEACSFKHNSDFPAFTSSTSFPGGTFPTNTLLECPDNMRFVKKENWMNTCAIIARFDLPNFPSTSPLSITFKAEEIKTVVNEDDNDLVVNVLILTSLVSLIILYYLLLLLYS